MFGENILIEIHKELLQNIIAFLIDNISIFNAYNYYYGFLKIYMVYLRNSKI